jgi:hypothetical protein
VTGRRFVHWRLSRVSVEIFIALKRILIFERGFLEGCDPDLFTCVQEFSAKEM